MTHINLHILPRHLTWDEFVKETPPNSIALDGFCEDSPKTDLRSKHFNFDHHVNCDRLATRCTTQQVIMSIRQGLLSSMGEEVNVFVNDPDQDVCFSVFFLKHPEYIDSLAPHMLILDILDTCGGFSDVVLDKTINELNWMLEPYSQARLLQQVIKFDADFYRQIINSCEQRILRFLAGEVPPQKIEVTKHYNIIHQGKGWIMCEENSEIARIVMAHDGIEAFIAFRGKIGSTYQYSIGRKSKYIDFPVDDLFFVLSAQDHAKWGGSDLIGGSNRFERSILTPADVSSIVDTYLGDLENGCAKYSKI